MPVSEAAPAGSVSVDHVAPPSVVPIALAEPPTAVHVVEVVQDTPCRSEFPDGIACTCQVDD
jgi:hypothetical protein